MKNNRFRPNAARRIVRPWPLRTLWTSIGNLLSKVTSSSIQSSDSGIFDPYVPLGSLKVINNEYQTDYSERVGSWAKSGHLSADYVPASDRDVFESSPEQRRSFFTLKATVFLISALFVWRLISLQITQGQENYRLAEGNRLRTTLLAAPRGLIYDSRGVALVQNVPGYSLILRPGELPKNSENRAVYLNKLAHALPTDLGRLETILASQTNKDVVTLLESFNRTQSLSLELKLHGTAAVELVKQPIRQYIPLTSLGNLLGYLGKIDPTELKNHPDLQPVSFIGKSGVEQSYDEILRGRPGTELIEVDALNRVIRTVGNKPSASGSSLILGLDAELQKVTAQSLQEAIERSGAKNGAAVALDVSSGDVLAMVSLPTFDNNLFSPITDSSVRQATLRDPASPLLNRAIAGQYPSGSTIKPFVATAGLSEGVISPNTRIDTSAGKIEIASWVFHDWKTHGLSDVRQALSESNNIFFYGVGGGYKQISGLGADRLAGWLEKFGFGSHTGIDIGGEQDGLVPTPSWKQTVKKEAWYIGDTYNLSIGQGDLLVTPLQLARATAAIANDGRLILPRLVKSSFSQSSGQIDYPVKIARERLASGEILQVIRDGMRRAVTSGSARTFSTIGGGIEVAAKTGTAQFDKKKEKTHSWLTAFAPFNQPRIAVTVIVEGGGEGFAVASPVAKNMLEQYFNLPLSQTAVLPEG